MPTPKCDVKQVTLIFSGTTVIVYYIRAGSIIYFWIVEKVAIHPLPLIALEAIIILISEAEGVSWKPCQFYEVQTWLTFTELSEGTSCLNLLFVRPSDTNRTLPSIWGFEKCCSTEDCEDPLSKAIRVLVNLTAAA